MHKAVFVSLFVFFLIACSRNYDGGFDVPLLHKIDIQQGNIIDQKMLDQLKPGMDKNQVKFKDLMLLNPVYASLDFRPRRSIEFEALNCEALHFYEASQAYSYRHICKASH